MIQYHSDTAAIYLDRWQTLRKKVPAVSLLRLPPAPGADIPRFFFTEITRIAFPVRLVFSSSLAPFHRRFPRVSNESRDSPIFRSILRLPVPREKWSATKCSLDSLLHLRFNGPSTRIRIIEEKDLQRNSLIKEGGARDFEHGSYWIAATRSSC